MLQRPWLGLDYHGVGYASEAFIPLTKQVFGACGDIDCLRISCNYNNNDSFSLAKKISGETLAFLPKTTIMGAIINYLTSADEKHFQPMNANFGILPELDEKIRDKKLKKTAYSNRAVSDMKTFKEKHNVTV